VDPWVAYQEIGGNRDPGPAPFPSRVEAMVRAFALEADQREHTLIDLLEALGGSGD
jgi:hypothetical protein